MKNEPNYNTDRARRGTSVVLLYGERYESVDPCAAARDAVADILHYLARDWGMPTVRGVLKRAAESLKEETAQRPRLQCNMKDSCRATVTHLGEKGYIYCAPHAEQRRRAQVERCRALAPAEVLLIRGGGRIASYDRAESLAAIARTEGAPAHD